MDHRFTWVLISSSSSSGIQNGIGWNLASVRWWHHRDSNPWQRRPRPFNKPSIFNQHLFFEFDKLKLISEKKIRFCPDASNFKLIWSQIVLIRHWMRAGWLWPWSSPFCFRSRVALGNLLIFFSYIFPNSTLISAPEMGLLGFLSTIICRDMIQTHVSRAEPDWGLWRFLYWLIYNSAVRDSLTC